MKSRDMRKSRQRKWSISTARLISGGLHRVRSGFPFMAGLPKKIATPRRSNPRKEIPPAQSESVVRKREFIRCARPGLESDWTYAVETF